jgi:hypothetical protein
VPCLIGSLSAFRWVAGAADARPAGRSWLARVFQVPEGEPSYALLTHISTLSPGERLWFERGILAGDTVLVAHEALSETPAFLATPRLMRRFRCSPREAAGLAELFLALDAGPAVVAHYEAEARRRGVAVVVEELLHLVARIALAEQVVETDALENAECLGDSAEVITSEGHLAQCSVQPGGESAHLAWHALGSVQPSRVTCPVCRAVFEVEPEEAEIPTCLACGARDTWEARQGARFRGIVDAIDRCPALEELAALGRALYALELPNDQAGVAWSHYRLRRDTLEGAVVLGQPARALIAEVEHASARFLPRLGACLYRVQRTTDLAITALEWRRVWQAYQARKAALAA